MKYRLLLPEEWDKLGELFEDIPVPNPAVSVMAVAENDKKEIVGLLCLQLQWHMEPLIVTQPDVDFTELKEVLDNQLRPNGYGCFYSFIDNEKIGRMVEDAGMQPQPVMVFRGEV